LWKLELWKLELLKLELLKLELLKLELLMPVPEPWGPSEIIWVRQWLSQVGLVLELTDRFFSYFLFFGRFSVCLRLCLLKGEHETMELTGVEPATTSLWEALYH
jgi:hypothetical protein